MDLTPYLKLLELDPSVPHTAVELRKAWLGLVRVHHPDCGGDEKMFIQIQHAYEVVTNPEFQLAEERRTHRHNIDSNLTIPISFRDAFFGRDYNITVNVIDVTQGGYPVFKDTHEMEVISFTADPNTIFGNPQVGIPGKGNRCGDFRGTLTVFFRVEQHPLFQVVGRNIVSTMKIPLKTYLKGGDIVIETMYGLRDAKVRPGDHEIHILQHGLMKEGEHTVTLDPTLPESEDLKQAEWEDLNIDWSQFS